MIWIEIVLIIDKGGNLLLVIFMVSLYIFCVLKFSIVEDFICIKKFKLIILWNEVIFYYF